MKRTMGTLDDRVRGDAESLCLSEAVTEKLLARCREWKADANVCDMVDAELALLREDGEICEDCNGTGFRYCPVCGGDGDTCYGEQWFRCSCCRGSGELPCEECDGNGC